MAVERLLEAVLIKVVANETTRPTKDKETIEAATFDDFIRFRLAPCSTATNHVDKDNSDATINIENEVRFLLRRELLDSKGIIQNSVVREVILGELLDDFNALIWVGEGLDTMSNAHDQLSLLFHLGNEILWCEARVDCTLEKQCSAIQRYQIVGQL